MPNHNTDLPPIPWHKALDGATHALWSVSLKRWYFWKVDNDGVTWHDNMDTGAWNRHQTQEFSRGKLKNYLKQGFAVIREHDQPEHDDNEEGHTAMNLENTALIIRDDIKTVQVCFPDSGGSKHYTYILHEAISAQPGDRVVVPTNNDLKIAEVIGVDDEPQINLNSGTKYKWVLCNIENAARFIAEQQKESATIAKALKQKQAASVRDQVLQQFGVSSHKDLLALGSDNSQSE